MPEPRRPAALEPSSPSRLLALGKAYLASFPRPVWYLVAATFVESCGRFMVIPYLSLYMRDVGVGLGTLGLVLGAAPVANVVFGAWGGQLSDRWGRKPVQILGVAASGLSMFGFAFAGPRPVLLAVLNFMNGMTRTFYRPATGAALSDHCPPERRSEAFALNRIALNAAFGLGPVAGVALFQASPRTGFILGGLLNLAVGLYIALVVPESAPGRIGPASRGARSDEPADARVVRGEAGDRASGRAAWAEIARDAGFWVWTAGMTLVWGAYDLIQSFLPLHFRENGTDLWTYGAILSMNAFICVTVQLPLSRRLRVSPIAPAAGFLMGAAGGEAVFLMAAAFSVGGGFLLHVAGKAQDGRKGPAGRA